jgi:hypothetical protein
VLAMVSWVSLMVLSVARRAIMAGRGESRGGSHGSLDVRDSYASLRA